jgi:hypothetical protein
VQGASGDADVGEERAEKEMTIVVRMTRMVMTEVCDGELGCGRGEGKVQ